MMRLLGQVIVLTNAKVVFKLSFVNFVFRKEVLEQKVNVVLNSLGFTRPIRYKVRVLNQISQ